ncbi:PolC-type DNA polymerase III [Sporosarcina sp. NPDC096371]|uniref:3'-5' exonuclease n=1 Tax=Sporosarcina sp. NPDC096371 TaxID=3364530 RepID=UPI00382D3897
MTDLHNEAMEWLYKKSKQQDSRTKRVKKYKSSSAVSQNYIVLDFETTGLRAGADQIIQIGAVKYVENELTDILQTLVNPQRHIPTVVTQLTGISNEMVESAPTIEQKIEELIGFIGDFPIIAHNASFDMGFLYALENSIDVKIPSYTVIDTVKLARKIIIETPNHKLTTLTKYLQIEHNAHDALGDCLATAAIYQYCTRSHE